MSEQACGVCAGTGVDFLCAKNGYDFLRCGACGFVFLREMPPQSELNRLYADDGAVTRTHYPKQRARLRRAYGTVLGLWPRFYGRDFLDLGCGGGFVVEAAGRLGARSATGIDISRNAIDFASTRFPRREFACESFESLAGAATAYDFVYSSEVIEHVSNLPLYMEALRNLVREGAYAYVTTPDIGSPRVPADLATWDVFSPPRHVQFFQEHNLARLFETYGFRQVKRYRDGKAGLKVLFQRSRRG